MQSEIEAPRVALLVGTPAAQARPPLVDRFKATVRNERWFLAILGVGILLAGFSYPHAEVARWVGFLFASYAAIGNDSIQTIGTFIASNRKRPWWLLWLFIGGIMVVTLLVSFLEYGGDISYGRLASKGFDQTPTSFGFLHLAAPLALLVLTRMRMPVSTSFMLLTCFSTSAMAIEGVLLKSMLGYVVAFGVAIGVWLAVSRLMRRFILRGPAHPLWSVAQWISTGFLWSVWLMQDAANIAVYLPRSLGIAEVIVVISVLFIGLGILFRQGGEKVQQVVDEKSSVVDMRSAAVIDLTYGGILYYFKVISTVPMSTTWVFVGLLAGRELAMSMRGAGTRSMRGALRVMGKDFAYVTIGLILSLVIALGVNEGLRASIFGE